MIGQQVILFIKKYLHRFTSYLQPGQPRLPELILLVLISLCFSVVIAQDSSQPTNEIRKSKTREFSYEDFAQWLGSSLSDKGLMQKPVHFVIIVDRTDSVNGTGQQKDVLYFTWRNQLITSMLQEFMVEGAEKVDGDKISVYSFGRKKIQKLYETANYRRADLTKIRNQIRRPFINSTVSGDNPKDVFEQIFTEIKAYSPNDNIVVLMLTDDLPQSNIPNSEQPHSPNTPFLRNYKAKLQNNAYREFVVFMDVNDFPNEAQFKLCEGYVCSSVTREQASDAEEKKDDNRLVTTDKSNTFKDLAEERKKSETARNRNKMLPLIFALIIFGLLGALAYFVYRQVANAYYILKQVGIDNNDDDEDVDTQEKIKVLNKKTYPIISPSEESEIIGKIVVEGIGYFNLHKLVAIPSDGVSFWQEDENVEKVILCSPNQSPWDVSFEYQIENYSEDEEIETEKGSLSFDAEFFNSDEKDEYEEDDDEDFDGDYDYE